MSLKRALKDFEGLKQDYERGKLSDGKYKRLVGNISVVSDGDQWKVDVNGIWYRNVDGKWIQEKINTEKDKGPQTLLQLLVMVIKSFAKHIPRRLILLLIIGGVTFAIHTYLVIYPNGGYWPGTNATLDKVLALASNKNRGIAFWTILAYLVTSLFRRIRSVGLKRVLNGVVAGPKRVLKSATSKSGNFFSFFMITTALVLLLGQFLIKNSAISYILIIGAVLAIITFRADLSYLFLRLGYQDLLRFLKIKNKKFNDIYFDGYQLAIIASMLLYTYLPLRPISVYLFCLLAVATLFYGKYKGSHNIPTKIAMMIMLSVNFAVVFMFKVYADDGGVVEAGGFIPWITSPGAFTAVTIGLPPSIGAALGGIVGIVTSGSDFVDIFVDDDYADDYVDDEYVDDVESEEVEYESDENEESSEEYDEDYDSEEDSDEEDYDEVDEDYDESDESDESDEDEYDEDYDDEYDFEEILDDLYDSFFGTPEDRLESIIDLTELGAETIKDLPGIVGDLINDTQDFVLTTSVMDALFDGFDYVVPEWFVKGAEESANELWDYMGVTKDLLDLGDMIPEGHPIAGFMDIAGILKDTFDNVGMGDNVIYAGLKSFMSNKIKGAIFDKNPALVLMDAFTTIFVGGSKAGDIISPGKTIQGSANFIIDKVTDLYNGTDDVSKRLGDGKYGGVLKIANETSEVIADAVYNTDEFKKDFTDAVTSDEFYDGMYETNKDLWKPKEGSWAIKRAGCYVGEKTFEGLIKIADGVHIFSSWLGSKMGG